ncbi:MAG TPA: HEAT repeat domain-containing protein [Kofleriaceae bacterium]|nr:HEAT repeat domain-containing protein [Kofleriaceae bacterium]
MARALGVLLVILCASTAFADPIDRNIKQLASENSYKVRLAAALALSKSKDARAVLAVADALSHDEDPTVRRVAALALEKMIDIHTPDDAKQLGLGALEAAAANDADERVRGTAETTLRALASVKKRPKPPTAHGEPPPVFVNIDATIDQSRKAPTDAPDRITRVVKQNIEKTGYATSWTGGLPTQADLAQASTRAFIVAATVKKIDISRVGHQIEVACTVAIRIAPWAGKDGGEKWEANKAASATGSAKAMTGSSDREVSGGMRDCLEAVSEDVTARQVLPFLRQLATAGS